MYEAQIDMGTPIPLTIGVPVSLTVDGRAVSVPKGASVMRAAAEAGVKVPKLCATDSLDAFGSCRVCLVEIHPFDAEERGIGEGDWCGVSSRAGDTVLRSVLTDRVQPGVIYTTFHFPSSGANVITTDNSDWATNCPEYKVTAVQVCRVSEPSEWQKEYREFASRQEELLEKARV